MSAVAPGQPLMEPRVRLLAQLALMGIMEQLQAVLLAPSINIMRPGLVAQLCLTVSTAPLVQVQTEIMARLHVILVLMAILEQLLTAALPALSINITHPGSVALPIPTASAAPRVLAQMETMARLLVMHVLMVTMEQLLAVAVHAQ